jgi:hypothetical protein
MGGKMPNPDSLTEEVGKELAKLSPVDQGLITRDQIVEGYKAYVASGSLHNERLREPGQSFFDAMCELETAMPLEENKKISDLIASTCGL